MKTALLALFFLLFAFCTQQLTTAEEVLDSENNPVISGSGYRIVDATNATLGVSVLQLPGDECPITVVFDIDPKVVHFLPDDPEAENIETEKSLDIQFDTVDLCARPYKNWTVFVNSAKEYPIKIGPPENESTPAVSGKFYIKKVEDDQTNVYNIVFKLLEVDELVLAGETIPEGNVVLAKLCSSEGLFSVKFEPVTSATPPPPPPPSPSPPPPPSSSPPPPPESTHIFLPVIRKRII